MNRSVKTLITVAAAGGALAVVSACGSSGGSGSNTGNATVNQPQSSTGTGSDITMHSTSAGTVLADKSGNTLYLLTADTSSHLACSGGCLTIWKPVLVTTGTPSAASGVTGTIGVVSRGSAKQVTVAGHPLYTYAADSGPGQAA